MNEWRNRIACWLFGLVCGMILVGTQLVSEYHDAHQDIAEYRDALGQARALQRLQVDRLKDLRKQKESAIDLPNDCNPPWCVAAPSKEPEKQGSDESREDHAYAWAWVKAVVSRWEKAKEHADRVMAK